MPLASLITNMLGEWGTPTPSAVVEPMLLDLNAPRKHRIVFDPALLEGLLMVIRRRRNRRND